MSPPPVDECGCSDSLDIYNSVGSDTNFSLSVIAPSSTNDNDDVSAVAFTTPYHPLQLLLFRAVDAVLFGAGRSVGWYAGGF